jgi:hypothetical protein
VVETETYGDGVDVEDGDLGWEVVQLVGGEGFAEGRFDEFREV